MSSLPILTVVGATGAQGGSVVDSALAAGQYHVRAITRNTTSDKAKALVARGAEVVSADLNDESSLVAAFAGSTAIYAVTDFFEPFAKSGPEQAMIVEIQQGKNLANAAANTPTLKHYIWSTLPNGREISGGKYVVPHFDAKTKIDAYIKSLKDLYAKTTFLWVTWYAGNYVFPMFTPVHVPTSGKFLQIGLAHPDTPIYSIGDTRANLGVFTNSILSQPSLTHGRYVVAYVEESTVGQLLSAWADVNGKKAAYVQVEDLEEYDNVWPMWGREMGVMMQFWGEYKDKSWSGQELIGRKELGLEGAKFVGIKEGYKATDWSFISGF